MFNFVYALSSIPLFLFLFLSASIVSAISMFLVNRFIPLTLRKQENVPCGYVVGTISVIYAVLAGFIILYAMNNFDKASEISVREASLITKIFRDASRLPQPLQAEAQRDMQEYADKVINIEFPSLAKEKVTDAGLIVLDKLDHQLSTYPTTNMIFYLRLHAVHTEINELYATYDQRMSINNSALNSDLWGVYIISSILTLVINCILGVHIRLHMLFQAILTVMVSATLFLIIAMDHPFSGTFAISSEIFQTSVTEMNKYQKESIDTNAKSIAIQQTQDVLRTPHMVPHARTASRT